ncbi:MAG TPA: IclR family transcriptional regulator [Bradyrhizobium sp.]|nr:IclR family transcriptional regulator [Bradyrhizobium sp.]
MSNQRQRKPEGDRLFISSLAKGLEVLQCFGPGTPELSVSDISRITRMPQPTVWRICHTLIKLGYLTNAQGRQTLRPGIPVLTLGYAALSSSPLGELALADMQAIASKHSGAVSLGARNGLDMVYVQRCQGSAIILADLRVGSRVPIATSATGWAYIAGLGANDRMALLSELGEALGKQWASVAPKLTAALQEFDELGYIVNIGSLHSRINSVAVPVKSPESATLLSLSSGGINEVFTPDVLSQVGSELKQLAAKLSPLLGRVSL